MTSPPEAEASLLVYPGAVVAVSAQGRIVRSNGQLDERLGRSLEGLDLSELMDPSSREKARSLLDGRGSADAPWELLLAGAAGPELVTFVAARSPRHVWLFEDPFASGREALYERLGDINSELVTSQRELARERAEAARALDREAEALTAAQAAVDSRDAVLRVVAHDLRNPLATVAVVAEMLLTMEFTEEQRRKQYEIVRRVARQMDRLVDDLLDVARAEAGAMELTIAPVPPSDLVRSALDLFRDRARRDRVTLEQEVPSDLPPVRADQDRVVRVLSNLVGNALKFGGDGGRVCVAAQPSGDYVRFAVDDDGPGIGPSDLNRLFTPFWQRDPARDGAGLGLAICRSIVELHGGEIWAESHPGDGARFYFTLPVA